MKRYPMVSICLVALNIIIFLICLFDGGDLYIKGSLSAVAVLGGGEYGRILWAMFLHAGTEHLFSNMIIILFLGAMIEREIGPCRYALAYVLSGVGGNILSLIWKVVEQSNAASIGASGAAFGLDGLLIAMLLFGKKRTLQVNPPRVIGIVLFSLYSGFSSGNIDNAAHVGGLLTGFIFGCIMTILQHGKKKAGAYQGINAEE